MKKKMRRMATLMLMPLMLMILKGSFVNSCCNPQVKRIDKLKFKKIKKEKKKLFFLTD